MAAVEVYLHASDTTPDFASDDLAVALALYTCFGDKGWQLVPAHDLADVLRDAGAEEAAARLDAMEEAHIVRAFLNA